MKFSDVVIPRRMNALMRDRRGYPVPYTVLRDTDGVPHFAVNDARRQRRCVLEKRCAICGSRISRGLWLVGGPLSAFHPNGAYRDPAMHYECMSYALQVCPYLAMPSYLKRVDLAGFDTAKAPAGVTAFVDPTMIPERPLLFVAASTRGIRDSAPGEPIGAITPERPFLSVEYWQNGHVLPADVGAALAKAELIKYQRESATVPTLRR